MLGNDEQSRVLLGNTASELSGGSSDRLGIRRRADEENRRAPDFDERQAPLDRDRRRRERLCDRNAEAVGWLVLGPAPDDAYVRENAGDRPEKRALPTVRLEQHHLASGERRGQGDPGRAPARADVDDRSGVPLDHRYGGQALLEVDAPSRRGIADRRQPGLVEQPLEPALETSVSRDRRRRSDTAPRPRCAC
jgi:hypothetical protein